MSRLVCLTALVALSLSPLSAEAEEWEFASPRWVFAEIKLGPYTPNIDSGFSGTKSPYTDLFDDDPGLLIMGELDIEFWRPFGTFAVGGSFGWFGKSAKTLKDTGSDSTPVSGTNDRSEGDTTINIMPVSLLLVYRADFLWDRWYIPLVPFVKVGLNYSFWWITKGDGGVSSYKGDDAAGGTFGWQFNAGLAFLLDVLEPSAAKTLDVELGINHSYIFFEFYHLAADGFGSETALDVGETSYVGGLALEF